MIGAALAVRSSAVGEDSAGRSFAGLHESIIGVRGPQAVGDAVRLVWASLWSDAALLYRKELGLDPLHSRMAVLVQEMVDRDRSGVAFARDPRDTGRERRSWRRCPGPAACWWTARWTPTAGRSTATREPSSPGCRERARTARTANRCCGPATWTPSSTPCCGGGAVRLGAGPRVDRAERFAHRAPGPADHHRRPKNGATSGTGISPCDPETPACGTCGSGWPAA